METLPFAESAPSSSRLGSTVRWSCRVGRSRFLVRFCLARCLYPHILDVSPLGVAGDMVSALLVLARRSRQHTKYLPSVFLKALWKSLL